MQGTKSTAPFIRQWVFYHLTKFLEFLLIFFNVLFFLQKQNNIH